MKEKKLGHNVDSNIWKRFCNGDWSIWKKFWAVMKIRVYKRSFVL